MSSRIFISGAHGSACSLIKSLAVGKVSVDKNFGTCHESWQFDRTQRGQAISHNHIHDLEYIKHHLYCDITIWLEIHPDDVEFICKRIVVLDFLYTKDPDWLAKDWCWTRTKHDRLAGPDWPAYSTDINDYPGWCLDEMCQVAWERSNAWAKPNPQFDHTIMTNELFGQSPRSSLKSCFSALGLDIDHAAIDSWRQKNIAMLEPYNIRFSWTPGWSVPEDWISAEVVQNKLDDPSK